jgi:hypothetical protein
MYNSIKRLMTDKIQVKAYVSKSGTGAEEHGTEYTIDCYIHRKTEVIFDLKGKEVVSTHKIFTFGEITELSQVQIHAKEYTVKKIESIGYASEILKMVWV